MIRCCQFIVALQYQCRFPQGQGTREARKLSVMDYVDRLHQQLLDLGLPGWADTGLALLLLGLAALLADRLTRHGLLRFLRGLVLATPNRYDEALLNLGAIQRLAHVVPALVIYLGIPQVPGLAEGIVIVTRNVASAYMILTVALAVSSLLDAIDDVYERLRVLPGITGIWQVSGRSDNSFADYKRLDHFYVDNWSLAHDARIVARTLGVILSRRGAS